MGKKQRKEHPKKSTQAKKKQAAKNDDLAKGGLRPELSGALSNGWVQNSGVAFLLVIVSFMVAMLTSTQVKTAAITVALVGTVALWIFAAVVIRYANESKAPEMVFSLLFKNFEGSRDPSRGVFWFRYRSGYGDTLSPASAALYMTIKNGRTSPLYIERLEISVQKEGSRWLRLRHIPTEGGRLYWIYKDITKASLLNMPTLEQRMHSSIPAGETISGWIFLAATKQYPVSEGDNLRWRVRARGSGGEAAEYVSQYEIINNRPEPDTAVSQPLPIVTTGVKEDLSSLVIRNYDPFPYE